SSLWFIFGFCPSLPWVNGRQHSTVVRKQQSNGASQQNLCCRSPPGLGQRLPRAGGNVPGPSGRLRVDSVAGRGGGDPARPGHHLRQLHDHEHVGEQPDGDG
ncbi:unnamed protein product, partial [Ectocarpus sp. 8 AP-2014]